MNRRGNTLISTTVILITCFIFIIVLGVSFVSMLKPFIMYEKLNKTSQKYMFVIEKFGYLTNSEKNLLIKELESDGFKSENIIINAPSSVKSYGELIAFEVIYKMPYQFLKFEGGKIRILSKDINLKIKKYSYSKI